MNEYAIAVIICGVVLGVWLLGLVGFEIWRHVWAWIDDAGPKDNWLLIKLKLHPYNEWIYPVYNGPCEEGKKIFGYAKDKKYENSEVNGLTEEEQYIYSWRKKHVSFARLFMLIAWSSVMPLIVLIGYKIYPITISVCLIILIAYMARFIIRLSKKFNSHIGNKEIHNNKKGAKNEKL